MLLIIFNFYSSIYGYCLFNDYFIKDYHQHFYNCLSLILTVINGTIIITLIMITVIIIVSYYQYSYSLFTPEVCFIIYFIYFLLFNYYFILLFFIIYFLFYLFINYQLFFNFIY